MPPFADGKRSKRRQRYQGRSGYDPFQARGPDGRWIKVGQRADPKDVRRFVDRSIDQGVRGRNAAVGPVTNAAEIERRLDINLTGFHRGYSSDDTWHAYRKHGPLGRDARPITREEIADYPAIIDRAHLLTAWPPPLRSGKTARVTYELINGDERMVITESILPRERLIVLKTMRVARRG